VKQSQINGEAAARRSSRSGVSGRSAARLVAVPILSVVLACSANPRSFFGGEIKAQIQVDDHVNQDSPVKVELIVVYDDKLLDYLLNLDAQKWFSEREQVRRDHPDEKYFVSSYWELVPGQSPLTKKISFGAGARGAVVFANYFSEGKHRARLDPHKNVVIALHDSEFSVEPEFSVEAAR
jgi:type VI secretion system protein